MVRMCPKVRTILLLAGVMVSSLAGAASLPASYQVRGQYGGRCTGVATQGHFAYVIEGLNLVTLDVTNPAAPLETSRAKLDMYAHDVKVFDKHLVISKGNKYTLFDLSQPDRPILQGNYSTPYYRSLALNGDFLYLGSDDYASGSSLTIIDISDPTQPRQRGQLAVASQTQVEIRDIAYANGKVYLGCCGGYTPELNAIMTVDVANPDAPTSLSMAMIPQSIHYDAPQTLAVNGNRLYSAGYHLDTFSIDNPSSPTFLSQVPIPRNTDMIDASPAQLSVIGNQAYLLYASYCLDGDLIASVMQILNVSDPAHPVLKYQAEPQGLAYQHAIRGTELYLACNIRGLQVLDTNTGTTPTEIARFQSLKDARAIAVSGPRAYVMDGDTMTAFDISNPAAPHPATRTPIAGLYGRLQSQGTQLFNLNTTSGLSIIDASQPDAPRLLARLKTPGEANALALEGQYAFVADGSRLSLIDLADPAKPSLVTFSGAAPAPLKRFTGVAVLYGMAYLGDEDNGLAIYDVTQPASPKLVKRYAVPNLQGWVDVAVWQNRVLLGCDSQWAVIDVDNPQAPQLIRGLTKPLVPSTVPTCGLYAESGVLYQYPLQPDEHPSLCGTNLLSPTLGINDALTLGSPTWHSSVVRDFKASMRNGYVAFGPDGFYILRFANLYNAASPAWLSVP